MLPLLCPLPPYLISSSPGLKDPVSVAKSRGDLSAIIPSKSVMMGKNDYFFGPFISTRGTRASAYPHDS